MKRALSIWIDREPFLQRQSFINTVVFFLWLLEYVDLLAKGTRSMLALMAWCPLQEVWQEDMDLHVLCLSWTIWDIQNKIIFQDFTLNWEFEKRRLLLWLGTWVRGWCSGFPFSPTQMAENLHNVRGMARLWKEKELDGIRHLRCALLWFCYFFFLSFTPMSAFLLLVCCCWLSWWCGFLLRNGS